MGKSNFYLNDLETSDGYGNIIRDPLTATIPIVERESNARIQMAIREAEYIDLHHFTIYIASWNVNGQSCTTSLGEHWLADLPCPPDIYAIGFQELDLSKEAYIFTSGTKEEEWLQACTIGLHPHAEYVKIKSIRLIGMMCIVFVRRELESFVHNIAAETVGTGILGRMGNKGGVAIRMDFHNTSVCFVNCHLAAHVEEYERRNQDYKEICSRLVFNQFNPPKFIKDHDHIYWFGDLNYRVSNYTSEQAKRMIDDNNLQDLLANDQLKIQRDLKNAFLNYEEGPIDFQPTYKYAPDTDNFDSSEKNRCPSWCDRVLWKGDSIKLVMYRSHPKLRLSDHKPVSALFYSPIKIINPQKRSVVYEEVMKQMDEIENDGLPQVSVDRSELNFGMVTFRHRSSQYLTIANTGQVPFTFEFIVKPKETAYCKDWLKIKPYTSMIIPGDTFDVEFEIFVDSNNASKLNSGKEKLYEVLVLHLNSGKALFITVSAEYKPSCFGSSIESLIRLKGSVNEMDPDEFRRLSSDENLAEFPVCWGIPKEVWSLVDKLFKCGLTQADLFQQTSLYSEFDKIRECLDSGSLEQFSGSIHSVAEALLIFLEALKEPLIPYRFYNRAIENYQNFAFCKKIVNEIHDSHRRVFYYLLSLLRELVRHSMHNRLDNKIVASIFGSIILRKPPGLELKTKNNSKLLTLQDIEKRKATFLYHFLVNDFDP